MQGHDKNMMDLFDKMEGFLANLELILKRVPQKRFALLPRVAVFLEDHEEFVIKDVIPTFTTHIQNLINEFNGYFPERDRDDLKANFSVIRNPFRDAEAVMLDDDTILEELNVMRFDSDARALFDQMPLTRFWCKMRPTYPRLSDLSLKILLPFPITYACESGFSSMVVIKTKYRSRLNLEPDFRCALAKTRPRLGKLVEAQQQHPTH